MADHSAIEWTDATWNPTTGCTKVSPGCAHCYIERTPAFRIPGNRFVHGKTDITIFHDRLEQPLHWKKPRRVFVNSLSDLFHEDISDAFIDRVFAVMAMAPQHTFQVLTKRPERMRRYLTNQLTALDVYGQFQRLPGYDRVVWKGLPLPNVWLGVSVENQHFADERIPLLLQTPAAVRFISAEPLLGPVNIAQLMVPTLRGTSVWNGLTGTRGHMAGWDSTGVKLDWVIVGVEQLAGGKAGRNAEAYEEHARSVLTQCADAGVAAFHKQTPIRGRVSGDPDEWAVDLRRREFPKLVSA